MAKADIFSVLYARNVSPLEFNWDSMMAPPLLSFLTYQDIYQLYSIAMSNRLASKPKQKYKMIDDIVKPRGFRKIASGTNRVVYKFIDDQRYCIKIAFDRVGILNNPMEYQNQFKLKPFVAKMFDVSPCGTVALCERVEPITTREEFVNIAGDIYDLIVDKIIGKYVVDDIGSDYFQNYGIRVGVCPVLLDYPSVYELDGRKLYCNRLDPDTKIPCMGQIDYDVGFNKLVCSKCGKEYQARQLSKQQQDGNIIVRMEGVPRNMSIKLYRGDEVVEVIEHKASANTAPQKKKKDYKKPGIRLINQGKFEMRRDLRENAENDRQRKLEKAAQYNREMVEEKVAKASTSLYESDPNTKEEKDDEVEIINVADMDSGRPRRFERENDSEQEKSDKDEVSDAVKEILKNVAKDEAISPDVTPETPTPSDDKKEEDDAKEMNNANSVKDYKPEKVHSALQVPIEDEKESDHKEVVETAVVDEESDRNPSWENPTVVEDLRLESDADTVANLY